MDGVSEQELVEIGFKAARSVEGLGLGGTVERVKVSERLDSTDRPFYYFSFLIDRYGERPRSPLARTRLGQRIRDEMVERDDWTHPYVRLLNRQDWEKVEGA